MQVGAQGKLVLAGLRVGLDHPFELGIFQAVASLDPRNQRTGLGALPRERHVGAVGDFQLIDPGVGGQAAREFIEQCRQGWLRVFAADQVLRRTPRVEQLLAQALHLGHLGLLLLDTRVHRVEHPLAVVEPQQHRCNQQGPT